MSDPQLYNVNGDPAPQSEVPVPTIADTEIDRAHVSLDHLLIRLDDEPDRRSVIEGGGASIVASDLSNFVEIVAVSRGKHVPLLGFSLFNEVRMFYPEERPTREFTIRRLIAPRRALVITIRPVIGPDNEAAYQLDVVPYRLNTFLPDFALNWRDHVGQFAVVAVALAICLFLGFLLRRNLRPLEQARTQSASPEESKSPAPSNGSLVPEVATSTPSGARSPELGDSGASETIVDGSITLQIQSSGAIQGLGNLSADVASDVKSALSNPANFSIDPAYKPPARGFTVMGPSSTDEASLTSPVGVILREQRPSFKWVDPTGAESYEVIVRDLSTDEIAASTEGSIRATNWTPTKELERGHLYGWSVTANREGNRVRIPSSGMGMFKVLDQSGERKLQNVETQAPKSRLVRSVIMYRLGLIDEAQREFALLKDSNPNSQLVRSLALRVSQKENR